MQGGKHFPLMEDEVMSKNFFIMNKNVTGVISALVASLAFMTGCDDTTKNGYDHNVATHDAKQHDHIPVTGLPITTSTTEIIDVPQLNHGETLFSTIQVMARTDPANPQNERFLDDWRFEVYTIDDQDRATGPSFFAESGPDGAAAIALPSYMFQLPLVIYAYNQSYPLWNNDDDDIRSNQVNETLYGQCRHYEIFVPPFCADKAVWLAGPFESSLWGYYREASRHKGEAWNPSQVDCATWLSNLQNLLLTDVIYDELQDLSESDDGQFSPASLEVALQENQHLLTPTRPPICMAERRHFGGGMERGNIITGPNGSCGAGFDLDDNDDPFYNDDGRSDFDPLCVDLTNGLLSGSICEATYWTSSNLLVNSQPFIPTNDYVLDDRDFMGSIHDQTNIVANMDITVYNTRLGNGRERDMDFYDDACAATSIIRFTNTDDDEQDILAGTGVTFSNLFDVNSTTVHLTSDGDEVVDDNDTWAIFYTSGQGSCREQVLAVELLGHRQEDFRDVLHMTYDIGNENLFIGLRADFELNEEQIDGENGYLAYTVHVWDGTSIDGRRAIRDNISNCYEAADVWARQFFITEDFSHGDDCCIDHDCDITDVICPLDAAEFAVRSQCFSNSRSNQRWRTDDAGYWSINTDYGVESDVIVNAGWLAPHMDFEVYIQKFDEAVFKGPRTVVTSDYIGQLAIDLPTLVEGDRVLIRAEDSCCDEYDLVLPCVPEFTGFAGLPGIPYVPATLGPPPVPPVPVAVP